MTEKLKEELRKAQEVLKKGGVILYPTDTVWGLGCDATNADAVKRIYGIKQREESKSLLILLDDIGKIASYAEVPEVAYQLLETADAPLTIIYPNARGLAPNLIGADKTIGIRITQEEFSKSLIYRFHKPIVSTSANVSGQPAPALYSEIRDEIKASVDYVVDYRREEREAHKPSGIIKLGLRGEVQIIRK
ncbi:MAG: threonylcarbamoyl-AMP synthase [Culturomica sp.]|jgi:L-threonylcarbamoyladenylate synthase|nr:threonylcarbamoyl-AMP synthase [Culturomica sp.]